MINGPGPRAIGDHLPIMPPVAGPVRDVLQIANHQDIWIGSTMPDTDCKVGIALVDLECINGILFTANIGNAVRHVVRDSKTLVVEGNVNTNSRIRVVFVVDPRRLAFRNSEREFKKIVFVREAS